MIELCGASKQLLLDVDERVNSSWERAETVRIARNADEFGTSAVQTDRAGAWENSCARSRNALGKK